jgi:uncharacterized protein involved in exopolysaccharide biosynthesis
MREQEKLIADYKEAHRGELPSELATNLSRLDRLSAQRQALQMQISDAENRLTRLMSVGDTSSADSPYARIAALRARLAAETAVNTEEHPNIIALRRQIASLEAQIKGDNGGRAGDPANTFTLESIQAEIGDKTAQLKRMNEESDGLELKVAQTPKIEEELSVILRKASVLQDAYQTNLRNVHSAELAESVASAEQGVRVSVVDRAVPPHTPERRALKLLLLGIAGTIFGAIALAILLELIDPVVISSGQLRDEFGLAVLGSVGRIG